ncbi:hypothetical protein C9I99_21210 [Photobacterium lutimaris]|uniref:Uncharacterized protein n=1 Tax=Photobacterium lutimaris TaxID=388278 RepID=A0A2T3ITL6_9GAMM|nr:hypothetical protein C9I99_21210 [Photobacterium lutimaris]TDR72652.1 hypothetical protein DFP78_113128 [Photobacterium lutimaris]
MNNMGFIITTKMKLDAFGIKWLPISLRRFWATSGGWFWMPCPVCGHEFGGHESSCVTIPKCLVNELPSQEELNEKIRSDGIAGSVRDLICSSCAIKLITNNDARLSDTRD